MTDKFYSILFKAECSVVSPDSEGAIQPIAIKNDLRPNMLYENEFYPCRVLVEGNEIMPGESAVVKIHTIPLVPLDIRVGSKLELRAAEKKIADAVVLEIIENKEIEM